MLERSYGSPPAAASSMAATNGLANASPTITSEVARRACDRAQHLVRVEGATGERDHFAAGQVSGERAEPQPGAVHQRRARDGDHPVAGLGDRRDERRDLFAGSRHALAEERKAGSQEQRRRATPCRTSRPSACPSYRRCRACRCRPRCGRCVASVRSRRAPRRTRAPRRPGRCRRRRPRSAASASGSRSTTCATRSPREEWNTSASASELSSRYHSSSSR